MSPAGSPATSASDQPYAAVNAAFTHRSRPRGETMTVASGSVSKPGIASSAASRMSRSPASSTDEMWWPVPPAATIGMTRVSMATGSPRAARITSVLVRTIASSPAGRWTVYVHSYVPASEAPGGSNASGPISRWRRSISRRWSGTRNSWAERPRSSCRERPSSLSRASLARRMRTSSRVTTVAVGVRMNEGMLDRSSRPSRSSSAVSRARTRSSPPSVFSRCLASA